MSMTRLNALLAGAMVGGLLLAGAASAQPAPATAPPAAGHEHMRPQRDPAEHLRAVLQLHPSQEPALQAFVASMHHEHGDKPPIDHGGMPQTTPERLKMMDARMAEGEARMHAHAAAILAFYNQLYPAQQRAFDALPMGGMHGHMHGRMMGGHDHMGEGHMGPPPPPPAA